VLAPNPANILSSLHSSSFQPGMSAEKALKIHQSQLMIIKIYPENLREKSIKKHMLKKSTDHI
jgi:hypothetical protein